jgi:hypothetical protein
MRRLYQMGAEAAPAPPERLAARRSMVHGGLVMRCRMGKTEVSTVSLREISGQSIFEGRKGKPRTSVKIGFVNESGYVRYFIKG